MGGYKGSDKGSVRAKRDNMVMTAARKRIAAQRHERKAQEFWAESARLTAAAAAPRSSNPQNPRSHP